MCTRFALTLSPQKLRSHFAIEERLDFPARFNIAPTQPIAIIQASSGGPHLANRFVLARWGFLPAFVKDPKAFPLLINARAEGLETKASYRNAVRRRRCLVPADAFYMWRRTGIGRSATSQPFMGRRVDGAPMGFAGLHETWLGPNGEEVDTACIITAAANGVSAALHPRLPVVIEPNDFATWLDRDEMAVDTATELLRPPHNDVLTFVAVNDAINTVGNEGEGVQHSIGEPIQAAQPIPAVCAQTSLF